MVRGGPANRAVKRAKIFALTKGFRGRAKNCYSIAVRAAHRALQYGYRDRRMKKRDMRRLWIQRINFAASEHGIRYSRLMSNLVKCSIQLNRKVLSELAIHEPKSFKALAELAKERQAAGLLAALRPKDQGQRDMGSRKRGQPDVGPRKRGQPDVGPGDQSDTCSETELEHSFTLYQTRQTLTDSGRRTRETSV